MLHGGGVTVWSVSSMRKLDYIHLVHKLHIYRSQPGC